MYSLVRWISDQVSKHGAYKIHRNHKACGWGGGGDYNYTYRYAVTTGMTSALWWAATRAILMFHTCEGQNHKPVAPDNLWRERRAEADSNRGPSAYQPNALPLGQTGSHFWSSTFVTYIYWVAENLGTFMPTRFSLIFISYTYIYTYIYIYR